MYVIHHIWKISKAWIAFLVVSVEIADVRVYISSLKMHDVGCEQRYCCFVILDRDTYLEVLHVVSFGDLHYHVDLVHMNDSGHIVVVQCKLSHDAYGDSASRSKAKTASMSA